MLDVKVEFPRAVHAAAAGKHGEAGKALGTKAMGVLMGRAATLVAHKLAKHIKHRVSVEGRTVQRPPAYPSERVYTVPSPKTGNAIRKYRKRFVSPAYPHRGDVWYETRAKGIRVYKSSSNLHRGTKRGTYSISGGMWEGLTVKANWYSAQILFRGRSLGQSPGKQKKRGFSRKVSNALKAATVRDKHGVNLLGVMPGEFRAVQGAISNAVLVSASGALGAEVISKDPLANELQGIFQRELEGLMR